MQQDASLEPAVDAFAETQFEIGGGGPGRPGVECSEGMGNPQITASLPPRSHDFFARSDAGVGRSLTFSSFQRVQLLAPGPNLASMPDVAQASRLEGLRHLPALLAGRPKVHQPRSYETAGASNS